MAMRIGEWLIKSRLITKKQLSEALDTQKESHKRLGEILIELGYVSSRDLIRMLSTQAAIPFVELRPEMLDGRLIKSFPERFLYDTIALPLYETDKELHVAIGDPTNIAVLDEFKHYTKKDVVPAGAEPTRISQLLDKYFLIDQAERFLDT
jgi:type IV pilus assembly protein PilB